MSPVHYFIEVSKVFVIRIDADVGNLAQNRLS